MLMISEADVKRRIEKDNFWWATQPKPIPESKHPKRVYFEPFKDVALNFSIKRAAVLLGPRRVGKTFMIKQIIHHAIKDGLDPKSVLFASVDTPIYSGMSLEQFLQFIPSRQRKGKCLVVFDEIQYLKDWELHLKDLVDTYPNIKFIATGSAAAALRLKSKESGAGRFTDFMLPPLTFYEFMLFNGQDSKLILDPVKRDRSRGAGFYRTSDISSLNDHFIDYLNFGGYPEAVMNEEIRENAEQFIRNDIIDRVLLKDLPNLYGIHDISDLNKLFSFLAYNAGSEASLENICQGSGLTKPTIKRYMEYLESAFLIVKIPNVDENCRSLLRERNFKVYLNNPSMRAALFGPVEKSDTQRIGHLAESAIFSQWQHASGFRDLRYARWKEGEVDIVLLAGANQKPSWVGEIKWSDKISSANLSVTAPMRTFIGKHSKAVRDGFWTTRTITGATKVHGKSISIIPSALYCYTIGKNITSSLVQHGSEEDDYEDFDEDLDREE